MKFTHLTPVLWTEHLDATLDFYTSLLGFVCVERNDDWGWASLQHGDVTIMLARPNAHSPFNAPAFTGSLYLRTDDVEQVWLAVKNNARVCYEPETFDWGMQEFAIYDNNGYLIQVGQEVA